MVSDTGDRVSLVLTTFEQADMVAEALDSALAQTHPPFEILVCDDASTDRTLEVVEEYRRAVPAVIRVIRQERNVGVAANRNSGIRAASGGFVSFLSGDDYFLPRKLERELRALRSSPKAGWAYSPVDTVDREGRSLGRFHGNRVAPEGDIFEDVLLRRVSPRCMLVRAAVLRRVGLFDESLPLYEDWDFKIRLSAAAPAAFVPEVLAAYRIHSGGLHTRRIEDHLRSLRRVVERALPLVESRNGDSGRRLRQGLIDVLLHYEIRQACASGDRVRAWVRLWPLLKAHPENALYRHLALLLLLPSRLGGGAWKLGRAMSALRTVIPLPGMPLDPADLYGRTP